MKLYCKRKVIPVFLTALMMLSCFVAGGYLIKDTYAASGTLNNEYGVWMSDSGTTTAEITVGYAGKYKINVTGASGGNGSGKDSRVVYGGTGGNLTGIISLKEGDVLKAQKISGGTYTKNSAGAGGAAYIIYLNGKPIIGAGGGGGAAGGAGAPTVGYGNGGSTGSINNSSFSSGGGGTAISSSGSYNFGNRGNTIDGCSAASMGSAGSNYLDETKVTLVEQPNGSTTASFNVSYIKAGEEDLPQIVNQIAQNTEHISRIASAIENLQTGGNSETPCITVVKDKEFDVAIGFYDDMTTTTVDDITFQNDVVGDGIIRVKGVLSDTGIHTVKANGNKLCITVIEEPASSNVHAVLQ